MDNGNNVDVSVYQGDVKQKSCGTLQLTYGLEQSDQIYKLLCNVEGDTVKLSKSTGDIAVTEVAVISTTSTGNVLKSETNSIGPSLNDNYHRARITDSINSHPSPFSCCNLKPALGKNFHLIPFRFLNLPQN